jgi:two-component system sensor histidine kinase/response regulator
MSQLNQSENNFLKGSVLIVDDTPNNLRLLSAMLRREGHDVRIAITGTAALKTIRVELPDLILLDINMPQMDGYEICKLLKANEQSCDIPVIFLSAFDGAIDKVKAFQVGGADYIAKPFQIEEVLARVHHQLTLQSMKHDLETAKADALRALERERELNRLKSEFISILSHDFRTPLTSIQGFSHLLQEHVMGRQLLSTEKQERYFNKIDGAVEHLLQLLDKILLVSTHNSEDISCQPVLVDLQIFCQHLVETLQPSFRCPIRITCQSERTQAEVDPILLQQILTNLLANAVKYSPDGEEVCLDFYCQEDSVRFQVRDRGIGIPEKNLLHIFEMFYRCSNVGSIDGTGLGLAAVKKCVEVHQGKISVESQEGVGSTFTVVLPNAVVLPNGEQPAPP